MKRKRKPPTATYARSALVEIVADALFAAGPAYEGKALPVLLIDTTDRPEIEELIRVHTLLPPGDVETQWMGLADDPDVVGLLIDFIRPVPASLVLKFSIERQGILVESALTAGALYLQAGRPGDRFIHDMDKPKVVVEVEYESFRPLWNTIVLDRMTDVFAENLGIDKAEAREHARRMISEARRVTTLRVPATGAPSPPSSPEPPEGQRDAGG